MLPNRVLVEVLVENQNVIFDAFSGPYYREVFTVFYGYSRSTDGQHFVVNFCKNHNILKNKHKKASIVE